MLQDLVLMIQQASEVNTSDIGQFDELEDP